MADNVAKVVNMARILAIVHIVVGSMLICFGIADIAVQYFWTGNGCWGIWMGTWMCVAGGLGIPGTRQGRSTSRNCFAGVFLGFSITSAVFGGGIVIIYSIGINAYGDRYYYYNNNYYNNNYYYDYDEYYRRYQSRGYRYDTQMALMALILILGFAEFATGIWAAVCLCLMKPCTCCYSTAPQQGQIMYTVNPGYPMTPFPVGTSSSSPMQASGGIVTVPTVTPGSQQVQPQVVMLPVSGAGGGMIAAQTVTPGSVSNPPQVVMVPASGALAYPPQIIQSPASVATPEPTATVYEAPQDEMSQTSRHGGYTRLTNQEDPVMN